MTVALTIKHVSAVFEQVVINFQRIPQTAPHCLTVFVYNGSKLRTDGVSDDNKRGAAIGWRPAACRIIKAGGEVCCLRLHCCF